MIEDDSVKINDIGVSHMFDSRLSMTIQAGTLYYMAPEQLLLQPPSPLSDLFSLAVVLYQTLTLRRPFDGSTEAEIAEAIKSSIPPPVSELNPAVSPAVSRVIHKAMAKQPFYRFGSVKEFSETLQRAQRNEPIEYFDPSRIRPRLERATKAVEQGNYQFASEILSELEAQGHLDTEIPILRRQIQQRQRQATIQQLLDHARTCIEDGEFALAQQKVEELLRLDPKNVPALALKDNIEVQRNEQKIEGWFRQARQYVDHRAFDDARSTMQNVLQRKPKDARALQMLGEIDSREQEYLRIRKEKEQL